MRQGYANMQGKRGPGKTPSAGTRDPLVSSNWRGQQGAREKQQGKGRSKRTGDGHKGGGRNVRKRQSRPTNALARRTPLALVRACWTELSGEAHAKTTGALEEDGDQVGAAQEFGSARENNACFLMQGLLGDSRSWIPAAGPKR